MTRFLFLAAVFLMLAFTGITLAVWLTAAGLGSFLGHRIRHRKAFAWSFVFLALLGQP